MRGWVLIGQREAEGRKYIPGDRRARRTLSSKKVQLQKPEMKKGFPSPS